MVWTANAMNDIVRLRVEQVLSTLTQSMLKIRVQALFMDRREQTDCRTTGLRELTIHAFDMIEKDAQGRSI